MNIRFVNMVRLFDEYYKTIEKGQVFQQHKVVVDGEATRQYQELQQNEAGRRNLIASSTSLSLTDNDRVAMQAKVRELESDFVRKREAFQQFVNVKNNELKGTFATFRNEIVIELKAAINEFAKNKKIDMVLDYTGFSGNNVPVVVYFDAEKDVTETLLADLNKGHEETVKQFLAAREEAAKKAAEAQAAEVAKA